MSYTPFKKSVKFSTHSQLFKVFFSGNSNGRVPDIVDFFDAFRFKLFSGSIDIEDMSVQPLYDLIFSPINRAILCKENVSDLIESKKIVTVYYTKTMYEDDHTGRTWHTPVFAVYLNNDRRFHVIKGINKILAAKLAGIRSLPTLASSYLKTPPHPNMRRIKFDRDLIDFFNSTSNNQVQNPEVGLEFRIIDGRPVPVVHWITIFPDAAVRPDQKDFLEKDLNYWNEFYHDRIVFSDMLPSVAEPGIDYRILSGKFQHSDQVRGHMPRGSVAYIDSDGDSEMCARLSQALVWLSSDASGQPVGQAVSSDGRYRIVFNNDSNLITTIPPGIVDLQLR